MVEKIDTANFIIKAKISKDDIAKQKEKVAKKLAKQVKVDGFRKGKTPIAIVKKMYANEIEKEAIDELVAKEFESGLKELNISRSQLAGEPIFTKFEQSDDGVDLEIQISINPTVEITDYEDAIPEVNKPQVTPEEIDDKIKQYAQDAAEPVDSDKTQAENGDIAVIDFEGYIDGEKMENGSGENYPLEIGSNTFIPGFEEQLVGMKVGEEKDIKVTFPQSYHAKEIAGKEATFKVKLNKIQEKKVPEINDELAKKLLQDENADVEKLKEEIKKELQLAKKAEIYNPKKEELAENLIKKFSFDVPQTIVNKEAEIIINQKASTLKPEELQEISQNEEKLKQFQEEAKKEAIDRVKLTFIVNELAKKENIDVSDNEVLQLIYFEALRAGEDIQKVLDYYKQNNLLPAVKMSLIEDKLFTHLLDKKAK
ncbi:MAG: trigger factor [Epsilonproteobacteria bacterium]|nr:trigger factor [Campylobacterota bacterium]